MVVGKTLLSTGQLINNCFQQQQQESPDCELPVTPSEGFLQARGGAWWLPTASPPQLCGDLAISPHYSPESPPSQAQLLVKDLLDYLRL